MAASASPLVMLPFGPEAGMALGSRLFSATTRWTAGDRALSPPETWAEPVLAGAAAGAGAGAAAGAAVEPAAPEAAMLPIFWPGVTVSPSSAAMVRTPSAGAETSTATLSVSISTSSSSFFTASPDDLSHLPMEPSATLSPMVGTLISTAEAAAGAAAGAASALGGALAVEGASEAPSLTTPRTVPGTTVSPSAALMSPRVPSAGETTSSETLSVSSSTSSSSFLTGSPTFLVHLAMVASVTDSPRAGVRMSAMSGPACLGQSVGEKAYQAKASVVKASSSFRWRLIRPAAVEAEPGRPT